MDYQLFWGRHFWAIGYGAWSTGNITEAASGFGQATLKSKDEHFTRSLLPGRWNSVEMVLVPTRADELAFFQLSMKTNEISLPE